MEELTVSMNVGSLMRMTENLRRVSNNIHNFEHMLSSQYDWNEALSLRENRVYIEQLYHKFNGILNQLQKDLVAEGIRNNKSRESVQNK
jgi:hypothetical protein